MAYVYTHGEGNRRSPYQIWTAEDLNGVRDHLGSEFIQMADIDLSVYEDWEPIGTLDFDFLSELVDSGGILESILSMFSDVPKTFFHGFYDGNGYKITNLKIRTGIYVPNSNVSDFLMGAGIGVEGYVGGLFGFVINEQLFKSFLNPLSMFSNETNVEIRNVTLENVDIKDVDAGAALAVFVADGYIQNCSASGTITCNEAASGLVLQISGVGYTGYSKISNSYSACNIQGQYISGFVLSGYYLKVTNCYSNSYLIVDYTSDYYDVSGFILDDRSVEGALCYYNETKADFYDYVAEGRTTQEMKRKSTYSGWDFDNIWQISSNINQGYPYLLPLPEPYRYSKGSGRSSDPYVVNTPEDLYAVREYLTSSFVQGKDIDLSCYDNWAPIKPEGITFYDLEDFMLSGFGGKYDGAGYEIRNMKHTGGRSIVADYTGSGLFGAIGMSGEVCNVRIKDARIDSALTAGMIAGTTLGSVYNCSATGQITNTFVSGGIVGGGASEISIPFLSPYIENCYSAVDIIFDYDGITHSYHEVFEGEEIDIEAEDMLGERAVYFGGIAAVVEGMPVSNCYSISNIEVLSFDPDKTNHAYAMGGIAGRMYYPYEDGGITSCYYDIEKTGIEDNDLGEPCSTAEMKNILTYEDWDFDKIWEIAPTMNDGYPYLRVPRRRRQFAQGDGTKNNPFIVKTPEDLDGVRDYKSSYFIQAADINMYGWGNWQPVITYSGLIVTAMSLLTGSMDEVFFTGYYNGNGYRISNLKCINEDPASLLSLGGLFGVLWDPATVENVTLENMYTEGFLVTGGIAACNFGTIKACSVSGDIHAAGEISLDEILGLLGGFIGTEFSDVTIAIGIAGGITGIMLSLPPIIKHKALLEDCYNKAVIKIDAEPPDEGNGIYGLVLGGITALSFGSSISRCYSTSDIELPPGVERSIDLGSLIVSSEDYEEYEEEKEVRIKIVLPANIANTEVSIIVWLLLEMLSELEEAINIPGDEYDEDDGGEMGEMLEGIIELVVDTEDLEDVIDDIIDTVLSMPDLPDEYLDMADMVLAFISRAKRCYYDSEKTSVPSNKIGKGKIPSELITQGTYEEWDFEGTWKIAPDVNSGYPVLVYSQSSTGGADTPDKPRPNHIRRGSKPYREPGSYVTIVV